MQGRISNTRTWSYGNAGYIVVPYVLNIITQASFDVYLIFWLLSLALDQLIYMEYELALNFSLITDPKRVLQNTHLKPEKW